MIYDCFQFFNELDMLEIRLEELYPVVDFFVICEATKTFSGKPKTLKYLENKDRYEKYADKIKYVVYDDFSKYNDPWDYSNNWKLENEQRRHNITALDLEKLKNDDLIMISDLDEIPKRLLVENLIKYFNENKENSICPITICSQLFYGKITNKVVVPEYWKGTVIIDGKTLKETPDLNYFRDQKDNFKYIKDSGSWHFSYAGTVEQAIYKIESYAHSEFDIAEIKSKIKENMENCKDLLGREGFKLVKVAIDETYPEAIKNNPDKYKNLI